LNFHPLVLMCGGKSRFEAFKRISFSTGTAVTITSCPYKSIGSVIVALSSLGIKTCSNTITP